MNYNYKQELNSYKEYGISVTVDGIGVQMNNVDSICMLLEENNYMREYIENEGDIQKINFQKVE